MIFPFQIILKSKVTNKVAAKHSDITLEYLQNRFTGLKASDFQKEQYKITFKNRLFNGQGRNHILAIIDKGSFEMSPFDNKIIYQFSTLRTFLFFLVFGVIFTVLSQEVLIALLFTNLAYGLNVLITFIRLKFFIDKLSRELESL